MKPCCRPFWLPGSLAFLSLITANPVCAQSITRDETLSTKVTSSDGLDFVIKDGNRAKGNLFHSFKSFSLPKGGSASFQQIDPAIKNVISRVTGSSASNINGLIQVLQTDGTVSSANFFLLNPKGIIFGPEAELDINGSFLASTASSLKFLGGKEFSAVNPQGLEPLLKVNTPIGLQFSGSAAGIQVQGANLQVPSGKTLGLVGGELTLDGEGDMGFLGTDRGRVELGAVTGTVTPDLKPAQISLIPVDEGWALGYEGIQNFQDIRLSQGMRVNVSGEGSGSVQVQGRRVALTDGSRIVVNTLRTEPGGTLAMTASESVTLSGISADSQLPSGLFAQVYPEAVFPKTTDTGSNLTLKTDQLIVQDGARVETSTFGAGNAGNLNLETRQLTVRNGAQVFTFTSGTGEAGNLTVQASEVELAGSTLANGQIIPSTLLAIAGEGSTKSSNPTIRGGNLTIETKQLTVRYGAVAVTTFSERDAGKLTIDASEVRLSGAGLGEDGKPIASGLFAGSERRTKGNGGGLTINTDRLIIQDGAEAQVSTLGDGDAGNLSVNALESVELIGRTPDDKFPSGLLAVSGLEGVFTEATGRGGNIAINTPQLIVRDGAAVTVSSTGSGVAGELNINARLIELDNRGALTAQTALGQGGNINLGAQNLLLLRSKSQISTQAGTKETPGTGGTITINTDNLVALENSDIDANAFGGLGGQVEITAQGVFGTEPREQQTLESDITASSDLGPQFSGTVQINTPDVDPSQEIANLPTEPVNTEIAQDCQTGGAKGVSRFISSGSGGLPINPYEPLDSRDILADVQAPSQWGKNSATLPKTAPDQIVEAQGWSVNEAGEMVLVAEVPRDSSQRDCRLH